LIDKYSDYKEKWAARNTLHTAMIEQAAFDRNLYQSSQGTKHVNLKFPEYVIPLGWQEGVRWLNECLADKMTKGFW
jgi:hypothetical protein